MVVDIGTDKKLSGDKNKNKLDKSKRAGRSHTTVLAESEEETGKKG